MVETTLNAVAFVRVAEAMLANGARAQQLEGRIPAPVLELAEQRARTPRRFRNVDPARR